MDKMFLPAFKEQQGSAYQVRFLIVRLLECFCFLSESGNNLC